MTDIAITINGREVSGQSGQTILEIARENGFEIPSLCHDERVAAYGSCGVCCVEDEGKPRLLRACSAAAADGMKILTDSGRVRKSRKTALELLLSDHTGDCRPPCSLACPARTDCQGYVALIKEGKPEAALRLIKEKIPLPGSIGRVCPHPCEEACRRELVEEPVSICSLKAYAADASYKAGDDANPEVPAPTGKTVAIVGGGPGGLSAAYFLAAEGHAVTVFDAMPLMGGMLRYGIPEYRLPKAYLQEEIDRIGRLGVTYRNNTKLGRDITLGELRSGYGAVILAVGAWKSMTLGCEGENLDSVAGGIEFLREMAEDNGNAKNLSGKRVAIVGGGNTAMDACRTAVRLGAEAVYNIYRRTKAEMPAEQIEITEAEEEGVIFKNLTNPIGILGENGVAKAIRLQQMKLGEPDASGRCAPVPIEGAEEILPVDLVIVAIGQTLAPAGLEDVALTRRKTIEADETSFLTSVPGVFAIGDATNRGASIAVEAIGEAGKAAVMVGKYLAGEELIPAGEYLVKTEPTRDDFADRETIQRVKMPCRNAKERAKDFAEVNLGLSEEAARKEAGRCLECGCLDFYECKLVGLAGKYAVEPERFAGEKHSYRIPADDHPAIRRNPEKCILCGLCVRVCDEVEQKSALGLVNRGFDTLVTPALGMRLRETDCDGCGLCVEVCPTGAMMVEKNV